MEHVPSEQQWIKRTTLSASVRAVVLIGPLAASVAFAWLTTRLTVLPATTLMIVVRWLAIASASTVVLIAVERQLRRLMPLVALLRLNLSFPDRAPSRVRLALRSSSDKHLEKRIADARAGNLGTTAGESAVRILELVAALNVHDPLTRGHSERVRAYSQVVGKEMGLDARELDRLMWAALLHDIGKLLVPGEILNKKGKLTDDEFDIIKEHPESGRVLVEPLTPWLGDAARAVWEHHERWAGGGYPRGIEGLDISLAARIVSVTDTFDVITSVRSYKSRSSPKDARIELARCAGTQFDPVVVRAFMSASIQQYAWMSTPAAWLAQTTFLPPAAISALVRSGLVASGLTVGGLSLASGVSADSSSNNPPAPTTSVRRVDDIELVVEDEQTAVRPANSPDDDPSPTSLPDILTPSASDDPVSDRSTPTTSLDDRPDDTATPTTTPGVANPPTSVAPVTPTTSAPSTGTPTTSTPSTSTPSTTHPTTVPPATLPPVTLPDISVPPITIPVIDTPVISIPPVTVPGIDLPPVTIPVIDLPDVSVPPVTVPSVTIPPVTVPPITVPGIPLPGPLGS